MGFISAALSGRGSRSEGSHTRKSSLESASDELFAWMRIRAGPSPLDQHLVAGLDIRMKDVRIRGHARALVSACPDAPDDAAKTMSATKQKTAPA